MKLTQTLIHEDGTHSYILESISPLCVGIRTGGDTTFNAYYFKLKFHIPNESQVNSDYILIKHPISANLSLQEYLAKFNGAILLDANDPDISIFDALETKFNFIIANDPSIEYMGKVIFNALTRSISNSDQIFTLKTISITKI
jgi:hypothetical protein